MTINLAALSPRAEIPHNYRILIVDDDEACAKMMMWSLEELGQKAQIALDGKTAIELVKTFHPELILLDIGLPGMTGYEICRAMRKMPALKNAYIVAQTGWGQNEHKERSKQAGFDYHLVKPVNNEALKNILFILDERRSELEAQVSNNNRKVI